MEENEKKLKALENSVKKEEAGILEEQTLETKETQTHQAKLDALLNKLEAAEEKIKVLESRARSVDGTTSSETESFLSKKNIFRIKNSVLLTILAIVAIAIVLYFFLGALPAKSVTTR